MTAVILRLCLSAAIGGLFLSVAHSQEIVVVPDPPQGVYQTGQKIRWNLQAKSLTDTKVSFVLKRGGATEINRGQIPLSEGKGQIEAQLDEPGWLLVEVTLDKPNGKPVKALGGALVAPEKIQPALPRPDDFDAFWQDKLKELSAVPPNAQLAAIDIGKTNLDYYKITLETGAGQGPASAGSTTVAVKL